MQKAAFIIVLGVLTVAGFLIFGVDSISNSARAKESDSVQIEKKWELPKILREVSGIAHMGNNKIACVQDEDGIIFIYDLVSSRIEEEIEFAGAGDYEGISLVGETAYVLRSDGTIFEVTNFNKAAPQTSNMQRP